MARPPRAPCSRTAEQVDYGDGPEKPRRYVMVCAACGCEAWEHRHAVVARIGRPVVLERERRAA